MARKLFGTDGIRGRANIDPMTPEVALRVAMATGRHFGRGTHRLVVIGKDTRLSGYMLEPAMTAGFIAMGMDVVLLGPLPTPGVAMMTRSLRADLGVVLSASHNGYQDNGIKLFGPDGYKLSDEVEAEIEAGLDKAHYHRASPERLGRARRLDDAGGRYTEFVKSSFPRRLRLDGLRIVLDCAHGAAYKVAPAVLYELGAEVIPIGVAPDGTNINRDCGATNPSALQSAVKEYRADLGIALDGDADRVQLVDERAQLVDGDQLMALIADSYARQDKLRGGGVVATVMSNLGLERFINSLGLELVRTAVGDRYVVEHMRQHGQNVGGEQSGHIVLSDYASTGDGLIAALQVLAVLVETGRRASEVLHCFEPLPQVLRNVRFAAGTAPLEQAPVQAAVAAAERRLHNTGRLLIRKSGTEPLIRVMAEGEDETLVSDVVQEVVAAVEQAAREMEVSHSR